jgi:hypothetical protein
MHLLNKLAFLCYSCEKSSIPRGDIKMQTVDFRRTKGFSGRQMPWKRRFGHFLRFLILSPTLIRDFSILVGWKSSRVSKISEKLLSDLSNFSNGRGLVLLNYLIAFTALKETRQRDKVNLKNSYLNFPSGEKVSLIQLDKIVEEIKDKGFVKLESKIDKRQLEALQKIVFNSKGTDRTKGVSYEFFNDWLINKKSDPRFDHQVNDVINSESYLQISHNEAFQIIARKYLKKYPFIGPVHAWTTKKTEERLDEKNIEENAMAYHSDSDYCGFLKFFILLTDVNVNNGPFTFVQGSHKGKKHVAGRMPDKEIVGQNDSILIGTGVAGDIVIADTMGWHKASLIKEGHRTMIHIIYMTSHYGKATV